MSENPKVSVILTSYNHAKYLREAVDSTLSQTFSDFELIIWDDASTDESWQIISGYTDQRIRSFRNESNLRGGNLRRAIDQAVRGTYIAVHHSDDVWEPQKLEKQVTYLDAHPNIGAIFTWVDIIDEEGKPFQDQGNSYYKLFEQPNRTRHEWLNYFFYNGNALCHPSVLIRKNCYEDIGLYRSGFAQFPDFDMWVRLCLKYEIHVLSERLVKFRVRSNEANTSGNRPETHIRGQFEFLQIYSNYFSVTNKDVFLKIFPDSLRYFEKEEFDISFALAMMSLKSSHPFGKLFGLQILFDLLNDSGRFRKIEKIYGFSHLDLVKLTAEHDIFSVAAIPLLQKQLHETTKQLHETNKQLHEIKNSKSWRLIQFARKVLLAVTPKRVGSKRILRLFLNIIRIWRNEGFGALLQKAFARLGIKKLRSVPLDLKKSTDTYVPITQNNLAPEEIDIKLIAFYLPQFHPIPENDEWWGRGFTEWTNVSKAVPNFEGHYQPHLPGELGYYDLRLPEVMGQQVGLAKKYGVYGFCFYYYWFKGKRLLERPLDQYLDNSTLDFPFCLCWANENWTRRWDGAEHDILIEQEYTEEQYLHFIQDASKHFSDPRYIRVDGKPMLLVYRVNLLPDPQKAANVWRNECQKMGIGEIYLVAVQSFGITDPRPFGFDAAVEFPPSYLGEAEISLKSVKVTNPNFKGRIFDYNLTVRTMLEKKHGDYTYFKTVMPAWDNTARKQNNSHIFINSSPSAYKAWLEKVVTQSKKTLPEDKRFIFVNAWNEWAEGTHLEPDKKYGYAYLQATADAITSKHATSSWTILFVSHDANKGGAQDVLINVASWFTQHTNIKVKVLCLSGGAWLYRFKEVADTIVLNELGQKDQIEELLEKIVTFCEGSPDLIYGNTVAAGNAYAWLHKLNIPILTHVHELESSIQKYGGIWMDKILEHSSHFVACSKAVEINLIDNHNVQPDTISTVYASIPSKQPGILGDKAKKAIRKKLSLEKDRIIIFGCGIGMPFRKGADLFIRLGETLLKKRQTDFHMYWIGGFDPSYYDDKHGSWEDHYAKLKNSNLKEHVTFLGMKDNPREYLSCGDIFVLPSREDPFPLVALEAADCGLPIVCFDNAGGMPDFVENDAGFTVPYEDLETMAQRLAELIEHEDLRHKLGKNAREKLLHHYTTEQTVPHLLSICRKVAGKKPMVSVVVPNYNHEAYLEQRLDSIFNQTFRDFEVILLDDDSLDESLEILKKYTHHPDVQLVQNQVNSGSPFKQWLKGIDIANADILWIAESDDVCEPTFLKSLIPAFNDPRVKLAYVNSNIIDKNDNIVGDYIGTDYLSLLSKTKWSEDYQVSAEQEINDGLGVKNTILNISATLLRRFEIDPESKSTLENMHIAGDWYFIVQTIKDGLVRYNSKKLNSHRRHSNSVIAQTVNEKKVQDFFGEIFTVQAYIVKTYRLSPDFPDKWEAYLRKQWSDFTGSREFDEFLEHYPFKKLKQAIMENSKGTHV